MDFQGKVALLVGASSGMGRVLALRLAAEGAIVVATARRRERLDMLAADVHARGGRCSVDYTFPWQMRWLIGLSNLLPKRLVVRILRRDVPPLGPEHAA